MPPTPLETHWTGRVAALAAAKSVSGNTFNQARAAVDAARTQLEADRATRTGLARAIEAKRRSLAEPGISPAELAARVAALRALIVQFRAAQRAVLGGDAALELGQRVAAARKADLERAGQALAAAQAEAATAAAQGKRWSNASAALAAEPLASLKARASNATKPADPVWSKAKTRVEGEIPKELRERAAERYLATVAELGAADGARGEIEALLATAREPRTGAAPAAARALEAAESALFGYVERGPARFDRALGLLAGIPASPALTPAEVAAITHPARVNLGKAAALLEKARDDKAAALAAKQVEVVTLTRQLLAANIDENLAAHAGLGALKAAAAVLEGDLATAQAAYGAVAADLEDWEATVPESAWANLQAFESARRELVDLAGVVPGKLLSDATDAATALVTALVDDDKDARTLAHLEREARDERDRVEITLALAARRVAGAVRGE